MLKTQLLAALLTLTTATAFAMGRSDRADERADDSAIGSASDPTLSDDRATTGTTGTDAPGDVGGAGTTTDPGIGATGQTTSDPLGTGPAGTTTDTSGTGAPGAESGTSGTDGSPGATDGGF